MNSQSTTACACNIENEMIALLKIAVTQPGITKISINEEAYPTKILVFYDGRPLFTIPKLSDFKFDSEFFSKLIDCNADDADYQVLKKICCFSETLFSELTYIDLRSSILEGIRNFIASYGFSVPNKKVSYQFLRGRSLR